MPDYRDRVPQSLPPAERARRVAIKTPSGAELGLKQAWSAGESVSTLGIVQTDDGARLHKAPDPASAWTRQLELNTRVVVDRKLAAGWVMVVLPDSGDIGYVETVRVNTELPDPQARLYRIQPNEGAQAVVKKFYSGFTWGEDQRFFVNALVYVNHQAGRKGIRKPSLDAAWDTATTTAGSQIWIPGEAYVKALKGVVSSGSLTYEAFQTVSSVVAGIGEFLLGTAALVVGLLHGALESLWDVLVGLVDLIGMIGSLVMSIIKGELISDISSLWTQLSSIKPSELLDAAATWLDEKWNAEGTWTRWHFRGWLIGYVIMEILMLVFTDGVLTAVKWVGKTAKLAKLLEKIPMLARIVKRAEAAKELAQVKKLQAATKAAETLAAARKWAQTVLLVPAELLADLALDAIERLKKLPAWAMERFRELNAGAKRLVLGCASPCKVKLAEILEYLGGLGATVGKRLMQPADVLAALPSGLNTTKIAEYLVSHPALMKAIEMAELTDADLGKLVSFLTGADKTNPETAYNTFVRYLNHVVPAKTGGDIKKFNAIAEALVAADKSQGAALKGAMFEVFARMKVPELAAKDLKRVKFVSKGALELEKGTRTSDLFIESTGALWDFKHSLTVDPVQATDYLKILGHTEPGLPRVISVNYLFATREWAEANRYLTKSPGFFVYFIDEAGVLTRL